MPSSRRETDPNSMFGSGNLIVGRYTDPADPAKARHPLAELKLLIPVEVSVPGGDETANLLPGDWVYFRNHPGYLYTINDAGDWKRGTQYSGSGPSIWATECFRASGDWVTLQARKIRTAKVEDVKVTQFAFAYEELKQQLLEEYLKVAPPGTTATREDIPGIVTSRGMTRVLRPNP